MSGDSVPGTNGGAQGAASGYDTGLLGAATPLATMPVRTIQLTGEDKNRIAMVFAGDGYTAQQLDNAYVGHVNAMVSYLFNGSALSEPFGRYKNFFNVFAINVVSNASGADDQSTSTLVDTALGAKYFGDGVTERLLTIDRNLANAAYADALTGTGISVDMRFVTVNSTKYGGSGGSYAVFAGGNVYALDVALHELAHAFVGLADEYTAAGTGGAGGSRYTGSEPLAANVSTKADGSKWEQWIGYEQAGIGRIGAYEGAQYYTQGLYRPAPTSKMRDLNVPFDAVAREQFVLKFYALVDPIDSYTVGTNLIDLTSLTVKVIDPAIIKTRWSVDGRVVSDASLATLDLTRFNVASGTHSVSALAYDDTDWVRLDRSSLEQKVSWSVTLTKATIISNGVDRLVGGALVDTLIASAGNDVMTGGAGADVFVFARTGGGADRITDFSMTDDRLDLSGGVVLSVTERDGGLLLTHEGGTIQLDGISGVSLAQINARLVGASPLLPLPGSGVVALLPGDGSAGVSVLSDIRIVFAGTVARGSGTIVLARADGTVVESFAADSARLKLSGSVLTIDPTAPLAAGTGYTLSIAAGALTVSGASLAAVSGYDFTTRAIDTASKFQLLVADGGATTVTGSGTVFGTRTGTQDVSVLDAAGQVTFDPSFNAGGDRVRLGGAASSYTVVRSGSTVLLSDGDTIVALPVGPVASDVIFADGIRSLVIDTSAGTAKLGGQTVTTTATVVTAAAGVATATETTSAGVASLLQVDAGAQATAIGTVTVFGGRTSAEGVTVAKGAVATFDPSFNAGSDVISLSGDAATYTATRSSSSILLSSGSERVTIPVGVTGTTIRFDDAERVLKFDTAANAIKLGDQTVGTTGASVTAAGNPTLVALAATQNATGGDFRYTHAGDATPEATVTGFARGDSLALSGDTARYIFAGNGGNVTISYLRSDGTLATTTLVGVADPAAYVFDRASAEAAVGFGFVAT